MNENNYFIIIIASSITIIIIMVVEMLLAITFCKFYIGPTIFLSDVTQNNFFNNKNGINNFH